MSSEGTRVAVVTVTYSSASTIAQFLESVAPQVGAMVVVDNPSPESQATIRAANAAGARVIALEKNVGYGSGVNAAVERLPADIDFILVSNPDVYVHAHAIQRLVSVLEDDPRVGAVGPRILNTDGSTYPSAREIPSLRTGLGHALFGRRWPSNPWTRRYRQETADAERPRDAGWLSGACLLIRRRAFDEIGGFDPRYFMYFEDVDLGARMGKARYLNRYEPSATVTHLGGVSTATAISPMVRAHHESARRFLRTRYPGPALAPVRWLLGLGLALRARWLTRGE